MCKTLLEGLEPRTLLAAFTVTSTADAGAGSLRQAIADANGTVGADTISFAPALNGQAVALTSGPLTVTGDLSIAGPGASSLSISGNGTSGVLAFSAGVVASVSGLTITGGAFNGGTGGGVSNSGTLTMTRVIVSGNAALFGAGVYNDGTLTVVNSTISGNSASVSGGAVYSTGTLTIVGSTIAGNTALHGAGVYDSSFGTLTVTNSTLTANSAAQNGGGIYSARPTSVSNSTVSGNTAGAGGGGLYVAADAATLVSSIVAGNAGGDVAGALGIGSINSLIQDAAHAGGLTNGVNGNLIGADPLLAAAASNGGPTQTMALGAGSPAIGKGINLGNLTTDQRGGPFVRGTPTDIGAYQRQTLAVVVDTLADENDGNFGAGDLSLREAVSIAGLNPGADSVTFSAAIDGGTIALGGTVLTVSSDVTITGPGAASLSVSGANASRVIEINPGVTVSMSGLTITGGNSVSIGGGGLYNGGTLTISGCTISGNTSGTSYGGGIYNSVSGSLTILDTTISGNTAGADGGGITNDGTITIVRSTISGNSGAIGGGLSIFSGSATVRNTTITANSTGTQGGGIYAKSSIALTLTNSTVAANLGGGGLYIAGGAPLVVSTVIAGNVGGDIPAGVLAAGSISNLVQDASHAGGLSHGVNGNLVGADPLLGALANNGGVTRTMALLAGSPSINTGSNPSSQTTDQRGAGFARVRGNGIDIGAFEYSAAPALASLTASPQSSSRVLTLTANSAADADGTVAAVNFYLDLNNNGIGDAGELVGSDTSPAGGYAFTTGVLALGLHRFVAVAVDNDGELSAPRTLSVTITNAVPTIGALTPSAGAIENGDSFTLTAASFGDADGSIVSVSFYADINGNGFADAGELVGTDNNSAGGFAFTLSPAQTFALPAGAVSFLAVATDNDGAVSAPKSGVATFTLAAADQFIQVYALAPKATDGLVDGDWIAANLTANVPDVAISDAYWGARNHWFQDKRGDVWALWHGGSVHESTTLSGQHEWVLTNLTDAGGLSGSMHLAPGSLSGITTGWNAFNIQGIQDGKLVALWWSPAGSAGTYVDTDGQTRQGGGWGLRGNGWSLSSISDVVASIGGAIATPPAAFLPYSESQGNGRTEVDPRSSRVIANTGMAVVVVDIDHHVYVVTFSVSQRAIAGARTDLNGQWTLEPFSEVPSLVDFGLLGQVGSLQQAYVDAATS